MSWESYRGDQWWYSGAIGRIEGYFDGSNLLLGKIKPDSIPLNKIVLHSFLFETVNRFKNCQVCLQGSQAINDLLGELKAEGLVDYFVPQAKYGNNVSFNSVKPATIKKTIPCVLRDSGPSVAK